MLYLCVGFPTLKLAAAGPDWRLHTDFLQAEDATVAAVVAASAAAVAAAARARIAP